MKICRYTSEIYIYTYFFTKIGASVLGNIGSYYQTIEYIL